MLEGYTRLPRVAVKKNGHISVRTNEPHGFADPLGLLCSRLRDFHAHIMPHQDPSSGNIEQSEKACTNRNYGALFNSGHGLIVQGDVLGNTNIVVGHKSQWLLEDIPWDLPACSERIA